MISALHFVCAVQNNASSGNFRVILRFVIHSLPISCRVERMSTEEFDTYAQGSPSSTSGGADGGKKRTVDDHINQTLNALFLVRNFAMRFVEKRAESSLLDHFNRPTPDINWNTIISPRREWFKCVCFLMIGDV